ncbi:ABC transporter permease [Thalassotalea ganghwensis]
MFFNLLKCEALKLKGSHVLMMTFLCPLAVVLLQMLVTLDNGGKAIKEQGWSMYWQGTTTLWYMVMLPLYVALITTLINGLEHKYAGWRVMATLPIKQWQLFITKGLLAWLFVLLGSLSMYGLTIISIYGMTLAGISSEQAFHSPFLEHLGRVLTAILPIIAIGHLLSWLTKNIIAPLAVGVIMTMTALKAVNSSKYWIYDPWTYHVISTMVSDPQVQQQAMFIGALLGGIVILVGALGVNRREIYS